jgi:hypothetical protein
MRTISAIISLIFILGFSVCASGSQTSTNTPVRLTPAMFNDYEFTLISDTDYAHYLFLEGEGVDVDFGQKKGAIVGLLEGWRIKDGNTLVFTGSADGTGPERDSLQFKSFGGKIVVTMDGAKYRRSKFKRPN